MDKNIGDMNESELKDFIIELNEKLSRKERIIGKAIEYMEESMNNPLKYEWGVLKHTLEILKDEGDIK